MLYNLLPNHNIMQKIYKVNTLLHQPKSSTKQRAAELGTTVYGMCTHVHQYNIMVLFCAIPGLKLQRENNSLRMTGLLIAFRYEGCRLTGDVGVVLPRGYGLESAENTSSDDPLLGIDSF